MPEARRTQRRPDGWRPAALLVTCSNCGDTSTAPTSSGWSRVDHGDHDTWTCWTCAADHDETSAHGGDDSLGRIEGQGQASQDPRNLAIDPGASTRLPTVQRVALEVVRLRGPLPADLLEAYVWEWIGRGDVAAAVDALVGLGLLAHRDEQLETTEAGDDEARRQWGKGASDAR